MLSALARFDTQDALYDLAWSETHENQVVVAAGDGSIKLFDIALNDFPVQSWQEHNREVFSVHWNLVVKDTFCSSSWDGTIKIVGNPLPKALAWSEFDLADMLNAIVVSPSSGITQYLTYT